MQSNNMNNIAKHIKPLKPKLRFAAFEGDWEQKRYGDIFSFYTTNSFSRDNLNYESGKVKNIHYGDIHTKFSMLFDIQKEIVPFINEDIDFSRIKDENYCQEGDLVIADASEDYNDVGKTIELINLNNEKTLAGLHTFLARPNKHKMQKGFAGYLVQSWKVRKQVMTIAQGSKVLGIATGRLSKIELDIPKLPEQQKIANFLTAVDTKLQQLTTKKERLAQYKKGVMQQLFSQQLRFKPDVIARTQDDAISPNETEFPDWEEKRLGEVCNHISYGLTVRPKFVQNGIPLISAREVTSGIVNFSIAPKISIEDFNKLSDKAKPEKGDIFLTKTGTIGYTARFMEDFSIAITQNIAVIRLTDNEVNSALYLMQYFKTREFYRNAISKVNQSTIMDLQLGDIRKLEIPFPCFGEQQKIATYLSAIDLKIEAVQTQITKTQEFKKGLLQQMFV